MRVEDHNYLTTMIELEAVDVTRGKRKPIYNLRRMHTLMLCGTGIYFVNLCHIPNDTYLYQSNCTVGLSVDLPQILYPHQMPYSFICHFG